MRKQTLAVVAVLLSGAFFAGCAQNKGAYSGNIKDDTADVEQSVAVSDSQSGSVTPNFSEPPKRIDDERQADSLLQNRVIYFDYDKSIVNTDFLPTIDAHADFLLRYSDKAIVLGGHADNRGSNEYNLALGQRRADAVRDIMLAAGVPASQVESLSFGEEYPSAQGDDESSWQANRRVQIRYTDEF